MSTANQMHMHELNMDELTETDKLFLYKEAAEKRFSDREAIDEYLCKATAMLDVISALSLQQSLDLRTETIQNYFWVLSDLIREAKKLNHNCR